MIRTSLLDYERIRFVRLLFDGYLEFREYYLLYQNESQIPRARVIEQLCQGIFQDLRECAHKIFAPTHECAESPWRDHELLCDLVIGACYHEMLQLQERLYLVKLYRPRYQEIQSHAQDASLEEYFRVGRSLIDEAEAQIPKNMHWIWQLIQEALGLLRMLLAGYKNNRILLRFLTLNLPLLEKVFDEKDVDDLFSRMFAGGLREALWESSRDLIRGAHYQIALDTLSRLVSLEKASGEERVISWDRIREALHRILGAARMNRDNDMVNRCEMLIAQVGET